MGKTMKIERKDEGAFTTIYVWPDGAPAQPWFAHRITIGRFDLDKDAQAIPPEPNISPLTFNGTVEDMRGYIKSLKKVEEEARKIRTEKLVEYQQWRKEAA